MIRDLLSAWLQKDGHDVMAAGSGPDALSQIDHTTKPIGLLVTDIDMPQMSGIELAKFARRARGECPVLLISGKRPPFEINAAEFEFLAKPFTPVTFLATVNRILESANPAMKLQQCPQKGTASEVGNPRRKNSGGAAGT